MKRLWSIVCICAMVLGMIPAMALTASAAASGDFEYEILADGTAEIDDYSGSATTLTIPSNLDGYTVTSIGYNAFYECTSLKSVTIPNSVTSIGERAFYDCESLTSITIGSGVESIEDEVFSGTAYYNDTANWTNGVLYNGAYLLAASRDLSGSYTVKDGTKLLAARAFSDCNSLTSITLPDTLTSIGNGAFRGCRLLRKITVPNSVTNIGSYAFAECTSLVSVALSSNVSRIGFWAFAECSSLRNVTIPNSVTKIDDYTFAYCDSLTNITIPNSVTSIEQCAFYESALTNVIIPNNVSNIGSYAFYHCKSLKSAIIGNGVKSIGAGAFENCGALATITIGSGVESIGDDVFSGTEYYNNTANWKNAVLYIGNYLIKAKTTLSGAYAVRTGTKAIAEKAFYDCSSLTQVAIGSGTKCIGKYAFFLCSSLESITIPKSVTSIETGAFSLCSSLFDVYYGGSKSQWNAISVGEGNQWLSSATIHFNCKTFSDVPVSAWYYNDVQYVSACGYITGYTNGTFRPSNNMTRQDFVVVLARIAGADLSAYKNKTGGFADVKQGSYYAPAVAWAVKKGIVTGFNSTRFGVGEPLTREQVATILYRYEGSPKETDASTVLKRFTDSAKINSYAKNAAAWAAKNGIITGKGSKFAPADNATRAQIAAIVTRMDKQGMFD